ncbi:cytochrome oxidase maturation protein, cbb3-type [Thioploca ingrica]|uniref:Cytochrome oxidase maturation protein, cbb3-type n=1 Tax=Thioploca ingrica TaxID=40754 RepID=A0A090AJB1_9GAMM|nr:cytochrome oxidase maturation protein, cbb3-type [Thioploca ingrica]
MNILYLLIPISLVMIGLIIGVFLWAIKSGQFDDLEGPSHEILMDNDEATPAEGSPKKPLQSDVN